MARTQARATTAQTQTLARGEEMVITRTRQTDIRLLGFLCWRPGSEACAPSNNVGCGAIGGQPGGGRSLAGRYARACGRGGGAGRGRRARNGLTVTGRSKA